MKAAFSSPAGPGALHLWRLGALAGYGGTFFMPTLYASQSTMVMVPQRVSEDFVRGTVKAPEDWVRRISEQIMSRTRLEQIINDLEHAFYEMEQIVQAQHSLLTNKGEGQPFPGQEK